MPWICEPRQALIFFFPHLNQIKHCLIRVHKHHTYLWVTPLCSFYKPGNFFVFLQPNTAVLLKPNLFISEISHCPFFFFMHPSPRNTAEVVWVRIFMPVYVVCWQYHLTGMQCLDAPVPCLAIIWDLFAFHKICFFFCNLELCICSLFRFTLWFSDLKCAKYMKTVIQPYKMSHSTLHRTQRRDYTWWNKSYFSDCVRPWKASL